MGYQGIKPPCLQCGEPSYSRKLCKNCYYRARYGGKLEQFPPVSAEEAFMNRIQKTETCWIWTAGKTKAGYGIMTLNRRNVFAHRHSYTIFRGPIPDGLVLMHSCDNPACVNPWHLTPAKQKDNALDARDKGRLRHGEQHHACRLTSEQVESIRQDTRSNVALSVEYGITANYLSAIRHNRARIMG